MKKDLSSFKANYRLKNLNSEYAAYLERMIISTEDEILRNQNLLKQGLKVPASRQIERQKENLQKLKLAHSNAASPERKRNLAALIKIAESGLKSPATKGLQTVCAKAFATTGLRKKDGTQKKGYVRKKGGKIVKVATAKQPAKKK